MIIGTELFLYSREDDINDIGQQQPLSPSKSNEEPTQKNGINPELALITSKSS